VDETFDHVTPPSPGGATAELVRDGDLLRYRFSRRIKYCLRVSMMVKRRNEAVG